MNPLKQYIIPFVGLKIGKHQYDYAIDNTFFDHFEYSLVKNGNLRVSLELDKQETLLQLTFAIEGTLDLTCDRCLAPYPFAVNTTERQIYKFTAEDLGEEEVIALSKSDFEIDVAPLIYEFITLASPLINVFPCDEEGEKYCDKEMLEKIKALSIEEKEESTETDPRWEALKKINKN